MIRNPFHRTARQDTPHGNHQGCDHDDHGLSGGPGRFRPTRRGVLSAAGAASMVGATVSIAAALPARVALADTPGRTLVRCPCTAGWTG